MARSIVPPNCNSGISCREFDIRDDFTALVLELMADEQTTELEASSRALELIDHLRAFAVSWDADAHMAGNPDVTLNNKASDAVLDLAPLMPLQPVLNE